MMLKRSSAAAMHSSYFCIPSKMFASPVGHCRYATVVPLCLFMSCDRLKRPHLPPSIVLREASIILLLVGLESVQYLIMGLISFFCTNVFSTPRGCLKDLTGKFSGRPHFIVRSQEHWGKVLPTLQTGVSVLPLNIRNTESPREAWNFPGTGFLWQKIKELFHCLQSSF